MKRIIHRRFFRVFSALLLVFVALFVFRLLYSYSQVTTQTEQLAQHPLLNSFSGVHRNYATKKYESKSSIGHQATQQVDQKYEKVADIHTQSNAFEKEEKNLREKVKEFGALIQYEQKSGNAGNRSLQMQIGVPPERFEAMYQQLLTLGNVYSQQIIKTDKTNEYRELRAQQVTLQKSLQSLLSLKEKGGKIDEFVSLENRILELERQLQQLGVNLGNFDDENEFCTIRVLINEKIVHPVSPMQRIKEALEWSIKRYLELMAALFFLSLFVWLLLIIIERLKIIERLITDSKSS